jgi:hypothetical protein
MKKRKPNLIKHKSKNKTKTKAEECLNNSSSHSDCLL